MEKVKELVQKNKEVLETCGIILLLLGMFILGSVVGNIAQRHTEGKTIETEGGVPERKQVPFLDASEKQSESTELSPVGNVSSIANGCKNWGLGFGEAGSEPKGTSSKEELAKYSAYYVGDAKEKKIYLTFDAGYENGNTEPILEALKKHGVSATFFVVSHYLNTAPELVKRMEQEGHCVGNHTVHHPDMDKVHGKDELQKELKGMEDQYRELTGKEMAPFFRPPQGKYSEEILQNAKELGYSTIFWSLAYADWDQNKQPSHEEAIDKLTSRIHPGAIVLLHSTSKTNGEILDELLTKWEEMGYSFGTLSELVECTN